MRKRLGALIGLAAILAGCHASVGPAQAGQNLMPATQTFRLGAKTPVGFGGCTGASDVSNPLNNLHYLGARRLTLVSDGSGGLLAIDAHNCLTPRNGSAAYGAAPAAYRARAYTVVVSDGDGSRSTVTVQIVPNRWDVTNIDGTPGTGGSVHADTTSANQFVDTLESPRLAMGDTVVLRRGAVIGSQWLDGPQNPTNGYFNLANLRIARPADPALVAAYSIPAARFTGAIDPAGRMSVDPGSLRGTIRLHSPVRIGADASGPYAIQKQLSGPPGGAGVYQVLPAPAAPVADGTALAVGYTAQTLPDADWIRITAEAPGAATIRHITLSGARQPQQGFWFTGLTFEADYSSACGGAYDRGARTYAPPGCPGFDPTAAMVELGVGGRTDAPSWLRFTDDDFQSRSTRAGQRGQAGIYALTVTNNGGGGCASASVAFYDNGSAPGNAEDARRHQQGSGAEFKAVLSGGVVSGWTLVSQGQDYSPRAMADPGVYPLRGAANRTYGHVSYSGCLTPPAVTPNMNGFDLPTGIYGRQTSTGSGIKEIDLENNRFHDLMQAVNIAGNLSAADRSPTDLFLVGNSLSDMWVSGFELNGAYPAYVDWNFETNIKYATGLFHTDCEIDEAGKMAAGAYYFGERIGNICVRGVGDDGARGWPRASRGIWADAQGFFMGGVADGAVLSGCVVEGNIYDLTYVLGITVQNCDRTGMIAFNTLVQDPAGTFGRPMGNLVQFAGGSWRAASPGAPVIRYVVSPRTPGGLLSQVAPARYNVMTGAALSVRSGPAPAMQCNVVSLGFGRYARAFAAPPALKAAPLVNAFPQLQSRAQVQAAFATRPGGLLSARAIGCPYDAGAGSYFDYVERIDRSPF